MSNFNSAKDAAARIKSDTPRVLIVAAQAFRRASGFGITVANLLQDYPADCLRQIYMDAAEPDSQMCGGAWRLGLEDIPGDRFFRPLLNRTGLVAGRGGASIPNPERSSPIPVNGLRRHLRSVLRAYADLVPFRIRPDLERWVREFNPDVVLTILGNIRMSRLAVELSERMGCPMLVYFLDDWPLTHYSDTWLNWLPRRQLAGTVGEAVGRSPLLLCISEAMAVEYRTRYKRPCEAFVNCAEPGVFEPAAGQPDGSVRFVYVGGLHLERWRSLLDLGAVLRGMSTASGLRSQLVVYAPESDLKQYGAVLIESGIVLGGSLPAEEVPGALRKADVLVHVESFLPSVIGFCRFSISTKIPQYMAAGRPVLCYGPSILASNQYFVDHQAGLVVGEQDLKALAAAATQLARDGELRRRLGENGRKVAVQFHDARRQRARFREVMAKVAATERHKNE